MSPENMARVLQAFPRTFRPGAVKLDDRWFPLVMSFGGKLDQMLQSMSGSDRDSYFVEEMHESGGEISVKMSRLDEAFEPLIRDLQVASRDYAEDGLNESVYLKTHNLEEQTSAEETVRADRAGAQSVQDLQAETVERSARAMAGSTAAGHDAMDCTNARPGIQRWPSPRGH